MHPNRPLHLVSRYLNEDMVSSGGGGGPGIAGITVSDNGVPIALPAGITTIDFLGGYVNLSDNGNPAGSTVTVEVLAQPAPPSTISTRRLNGAPNAGQSVLNWDVDQGTTLSVAPAGQTNITLFDPATYVYHGTNTRANNGGAGTTTIGPSARTNNSENGTAIGKSTQALNGKSPSAFGDLANANFDYALAMGFFATCRAPTATAIGANSDAQNASSTCCGNGAVSAGNSGSSFGHNASSSSTNAQAFGSASFAAGDNACAYGYDARATAIDSCAFGAKTRATAQNSVAFGLTAQAYGVQSCALGPNCVVYATDGVGVGAVDCDGAESCAIGSGAQTQNARSCSFGAASNCAAFTDLLAVGYGANALQVQTTAIGQGSTANGSLATVVGNSADCQSDDGTVVGTGARITASTPSGCAFGVNAIVETLDPLTPTEGSCSFGTQAYVNASECVAIGTRASITGGPQSVLVGHRGTVESAQCCGIGKDAVISTNCDGSIAVGYAATVQSSASGVLAIGSGANVNSGCSKSTVVGSGASSQASQSLCLGFGSVSTVDLGISIGGEPASAFSPNAAAPATVDCPLAMFVADGVLQTGAGGAQTHRLRIRINGGLYEIRLTELVAPPV
jgi:hypothetical protein